MIEIANCSTELNAFLSFLRTCEESNRLAILTENDMDRQTQDILHNIELNENSQYDYICQGFTLRDINGCLIGASAGDNEALKQQIADLQEQNRQKDTEHQNELKALKLTNAIKMAISSTAQDSDLVAGLVDRNKLILGEDGKVTGLEEQVKALKESKPFLFKQEQQTGKGKKGFFPLGAPKAEPGGEEGHVSMKEAIAAKLNLGSEGKGE